MVRTNFSGREIASVLHGFGYKRVGRVDDILPGVNAGVSSRWGYRLPTHGGNLRVRALLVGTRAW